MLLAAGLTPENCGICGFLPVFPAVAMSVPACAGQAGSWGYIPSILFIPSIPSC